MLRFWALGVLALYLVPAWPDELAEAVPSSVADGIYTEEQSRRGELIYPSVCGRCHGYLLDGAPDDPDMLPAPPIAGPKFLRKWEGASLAALFELTRTTMPEINPGSLSGQEFVDVIAYMLKVSGFPAGDRELQAAPVTMARIMLNRP